MAPQNRIWTLNDVTNNRESNNEEPSIRSSQAPKSSGDASTTRNNPLAAPYCQPASSNGGTGTPSTIPLYQIPNMAMDDVCADTLSRIFEEFYPIIKRRGYNVLSISELCCCGDGLDHAPGRRRKLRKQSANVWGYNTTMFGGGRSRKSHTIHLRLRQPRNHMRLLPWEDVAGTMAHELSHCIHGNHGPAFEKLMEEILDGMYHGLTDGVVLSFCERF